MRYRIAAFTHWVNLTGLGGGLLWAFFSGSPILGLLTLGVEAAALWILPDLPAFRAIVDIGGAERRVDKERAFYIKELFGVAQAANPKLFAADRAEWVGVAVRHNHDSWKEFLDLYGVVDQLRDIARVRHDSDLTSARLVQVDLALNGWLRLLFAQKALTRAVERANEEALWARVDDLKEQIRKAPAVHGAVLKERLRLALHQLRAVPKLKARLELCNAKAETIAFSLRQMGDAAAASQGSDVALLAEGLVDQYEFLERDLSELAAQNDMRELMGEIDWTAELEATPTKAALSAPRADEDLDALEAELRAGSWEQVPARKGA